MTPGRIAGRAALAAVLFLAMTLAGVLAMAALLPAAQPADEVAQDCREVYCREAAGTAFCIPLCEQGCRRRTQICALGFAAVTEAVIRSQPPSSPAAARFVDEVVSLVRAAGVADSALLDEVEVRVCRLYLSSGMAPDRNLICLSDRYFHDGSVLGAAITLAHELTHSRQYRRLGSASFECAYTREFLRCKGCQDAENRFEKEAFERQAEAEPLIRHFHATGKRLLSE